jgi:glucokinase
VNTTGYHLLVFGQNLRQGWKKIGSQRTSDYASESRKGAPMTAKKTYWLGFDLGGTKMYATVFDGSFKPLGQARKKTKGALGAAKGTARVVEVMDEALQSARLQRTQLCGIGIGVPGPLNLNAGIVLDTPNLGWKNLHLKKILQNRFGCPVHLLNDVDAGTYGEYRFGAAQGARCAVGIFPGTGIGGACIYEGHILRGKTGSAMEIGHVRLLPDGPRCGCGQRGCLEALASRLAVSRAAAAAACRGQAPWLAEHIGTDLSDIRSGALAESVRNGDAAVEQILRDAARWIGIGAAGAINLLAPDVIVLGGGLVEALPQLFKNEVTAVAREYVMAPFRNAFRVRIAKLGDDAGVRGAAAWAAAQVAGDPQ